MPPPISKPFTAQLPPAQRAGYVSGTGDLDKTPSLPGAGTRMGSYAALTLPESAVRSTPSADSSGDKESNRLSYSLLFSLRSISHNGASEAPSASSSTTGSVRGGVVDVPGPVPMSPAMGLNRTEASSAPTTATDPISVTTASHTHRSGTTQTPVYQYAETSFLHGSNRSWNPSSTPADSSRTPKKSHLSNAKYLV